MLKKVLYTGIFALAFLTINAQDGPPANWFNLDKSADGVYGVRTEKAYDEMLKGKSSVPVVVAVIDSGVDAEHEDLDDVMWKNPGEIAGNGIDDDKNGYIDDVHGWNFIGGKDGNVDSDNLEVTRLYRKYKYKYESADPEKLTKQQKKEYAIYKKTKEVVEAEIEKSKTRLASVQGNIDMIGASLDNVAEIMGLDNVVTQAELDSLAGVDAAKFGIAANVAKQVSPDANTIKKMKGEVSESFNGAIDYYTGQMEKYYNVDFDPRDIVGDDYKNIEEKIYGNNDVEGPDAFHGTHVAGIIAAERENGLGMNGVADNVQIMSVRTVPDGDERDKDVANAIIYAVDNGASVVNMSFGKGFSWDEKAVEKAIKYAEKNDVLLVHAAGNSSQDNDTTDNFPNSMYQKKFLWMKKNKQFKNWIEVGALNWKEGEDTVAPFSNYGQKQVDVFAPGMAIYSTTPDNNYQNAQGTSMAAPVVAGVAALIRSYYPSLTAQQVKEIIMASSNKKMIKVKKPGTDELVDFSTLSVSGGQIDAYKALELASQTTGKKKIKQKKA